MESESTVSKNYSWADVDWDALRRLRARFLQFDTTTGAAADYWKSSRELASYDFTFAERIGWKWDRVLAELAALGWTPPEGSVLDWGCGTGVAGRRVAAQWPEQVKKLLLWDRSRAAQQFAAQRARSTFPKLSIERLEAGAGAETLVISHVLNELSNDGLDRLLAVVKQAQTVIWVEPGTHAASRKLIAVRAQLMQFFRPVAPCSHAGACGLLTAENERHWCHHFAQAPREVFQDSGWGKFAKLVEVDLATVPFSYLVLDRRPVALSSGAARSRVIGVPRYFKGFDKVLSCEGEEGVMELVLQKRDAGELHKQMKKEPGSLYEWERDGDKIRSGQKIF